MIHETARLILRPWADDDAEELYRYAKDPLVGPAAGWAVHESVEDSRAIIQTVFSAEEMYAVVLKSTGKPIGSIGLLMGEGSDLCVLPADECEMGYWIGVPYWGQGLIVEAAEALLRHAFETLGMNKVWCSSFENNKQSQRVQEKCGFRYIRDKVLVSPLGETRTVKVTCITKEEYHHGK